MRRKKAPSVPTQTIFCSLEDKKAKKKAKMSRAIFSVLYILSLNYNNGKRDAYLEFFEKLRAVCHESDQLHTLWKLSQRFGAFPQMCDLLRRRDPRKRIDGMRMELARIVHAADTSETRSLMTVIKEYESCRAANCSSISSPQIGGGGGKEKGCEAPKHGVRAPLGERRREERNEPNANARISLVR